MAYKFGDWKKVELELKRIPLKAKKLREYVLDISSRQFQEGIQTEIVKNRVEPDNKAFIAQEYAERISIDKKPQLAFIGLKKGEMIRESDLGEFAILAEFGLLGPRFMGIWRRFMDKFEIEFKKNIEQINKE